jgi:hypothetical protein
MNSTALCWRDTQSGLADFALLMSKSQNKAKCSSSVRRVDGGALLSRALDVVLVGPTDLASVERAEPGHRARHRLDPAIDVVEARKWLDRHVGASAA